MCRCLDHAVIVAPLHDTDLPGCNQANRLSPRDTQLNIKRTANESRRVLCRTANNKLQPGLETKLRPAFSTSRRASAGKHTGG